MCRQVLMVACGLPQSPVHLLCSDLPDHFSRYGDRPLALEHGFPGFRGIQIPCSLKGRAPLLD